MKNIKSFLCTAAIGLMLIVQLLHPASVFADGEATPPPTNTPEVTATPQATEPVVETTIPTGTPEITSTPEETTPTILPTDTVPLTDLPVVTPTTNPNEPTMEPALATPIATEFATPGAGEPTVEPVATTPAPTEILTEEEDETKVAPTDANTPTAEPVVSEEDSTVDEPSLGEVLSEIPAETEVVVLNENGQPEPLATVEAAETIYSGDPIWCPEGQAPTPEANGCTKSYATLGALVANAGGNIAANGTIWIASGATLDVDPVVISGCLVYDGVKCISYSSWANYSLTLQGGWSGISGDTTIGSNTILSGPISIINWNNGVAIQNVEASSINLSNITSNQGSSVSIINTGSNINLNDIRVNGSTWTGLYVNTTGPIQGANITSNNNQGHGAELDSTQSITLTGTNEFNNNSVFGFYSESGSADFFLPESILLNNITSNGNGLIGIDVSAYSNITMNNVTTNGNGSTGVHAYASDNLTMINVIANDNGSTGVYAYGATNLTMNNVTANNNTSTGISIMSAGNIYLTGGEVTQNKIGLYVNCVNSLQFNLPLTNISGNTNQNISIDPSCPSPVIVTATPVVLQVPGQFTLDCSKQAEFPVKLPNGDLVNIFCPVSGTARIYRLDNTGLPENLPEGYTYASAFTLDILQQDEPIPVITEGGYVKSSFVAQPLLPGNTYTVLYWDPWVNENGELVENLAGGSWVPLKDFLFDGDGNTESFDLFPGTDDPRRVISGVNRVERNGSESIEVSTNFPGIFVLAQH